MDQSLWQDIMANVTQYYDDLVALFPKIVACLIVGAVGLVVFKILKRILVLKLSTILEDTLITRFIIRVVKIILMGIVLLICLKIIGLGKVATGIWGTAGVGAFIIGFAFKDIGEHFLAGFILAFSRPFKVGDTIEVNGMRGKVVELDMRNTHIKTFSGKDVYIPNGIVIKNALTNDTTDGFIRNEFSLEISKSADLTAASNLLLAELDKIDGILKNEKKSSVWIDKVEGSKIRIVAFYWLDTFDKTINGGLIRRTAIQQSILALENAGIELPGHIVQMRSKPS